MKLPQQQMFHAKQNEHYALTTSYGDIHSKWAIAESDAQSAINSDAGDNCWFCNTTQENLKKPWMNAVASLKYVKAGACASSSNSKDDRDRAPPSGEKPLASTKRGNRSTERVIETLAETDG